MVKRLSTISGHQASKQRTRIRQRDNYTCQMCLRAVAKGEVDHKVALDNGGSDEDDNLWLLCSPCHYSKTCRDMGYVERTGVDVNGIPLGTSHHWSK